MRKTRNIILIIVLILIVLAYSNTLEDGTQTILKIVGLFDILLITLNNITD